VRIGEVEVRYLSHVSFLFTSPGGKTVLTDPLFADGFPWEGARERYLSPPEVDVTDITACDTVFVSHVHGDHCDVDALSAIQKNTGAPILAPAEVLEAIAHAGGNSGLLVEVVEGGTCELGDFALTTFAGYDGSLDEQGRPNKFSLVIECGATRLFYSGDCHEIPPAVRGTEFDAMFCWPHTTDERLKALCADVDAKRFVIMHCDRFEPGNFLCNLDPIEQKRRVEGLVPGIEVVVPERATSL